MTAESDGPAVIHFPAAEGLKISSLAGLFCHTTGCRGFVFFPAILDPLRRHHFDAERPHTDNMITVEMLAVA